MICISIAFEAFMHDLVLYCFDRGSIYIYIEGLDIALTNVVCRLVSRLVAVAPPYRISKGNEGYAMMYGKQVGLLIEGEGAHDIQTAGLSSSVSDSTPSSGFSGHLHGRQE